MDGGIQCLGAGF